MNLITLLIYSLVACLPFPFLDLQTPTPPVVHAVMFWMDSCPHCHYVLENVLPPIQEKYGEQFQIQLIELVGGEEAAALFQLADKLGIDEEDIGVPFLAIGDHALIGSKEIPEELPSLIDAYLASGGVDWPDIPGLVNASQTATPSPTTKTETPTTPAPLATERPAAAKVRAVLFNSPDCYDCRAILAEAVLPARQEYGIRFELKTIDIITSDDVLYLYQVGETLGLEKEQIDLPLLILGDSVLVGEQIVTDLHALIERQLAANGSEYPLLPTRAFETAGAPLPTQPVLAAPLTHPAANGFGLAVIVLVGLLAVLIYTGLAFQRRLQGLEGPPPVRLGQYEWLIPLLALIGLGVAGYLAYVETQAVRAVCGPVGDCNTVQSSSYARLFGVLPVGVLGLIGYALILLAWIVHRTGNGRTAAWAALALFGMAYGGTLFSLYLTYLEPFVILAVCAWCLSSAATMALLCLFSLDAALRQIKPGGLRDERCKA
ncbi:MAG: hypothetical protein JXA78_12070 [Anaerolineales bacterium]|nr:hypothetical protein [Anaerolineales bacterium]